jgi:alpha-beta hydrolase superfamily lysophospholipase
LVVILVAIAASMLAMRAIVFRVAEGKLFLLHQNGRSTPAEFGSPYQMSWIPSGIRRLEAYIVRVAPSCPDRVAVLVFHGAGETISSWSKAQAFLSRHCVSSEVFDYSGYGSSTPPAHISTLNADATAAYNDFAERFPYPWRRCVMSHSMGASPMLHGYPSFQPTPDCIIIANGFSSVQDFARAEGTPGPIAAFLNGTWDNVEAIKDVKTRLMLVHSDADKEIPSALAERLETAAPTNALRIRVHGFGHNALFKDPADAWWTPVLTFIRSV